MRKITLLVTCLVATLGMVLSTASPASAHPQRAYAGIYGFGEAYGDNHTWLAACDTRADGIGVYAQGKLANGQILTVNDSNGSAPDCGRASNGVRIVEVRGVARNGVDSGWVRVE
jgi:hypothetical protein